MPQLHLPRLPHFRAWDGLLNNHFSVLRMFLFYALPLSALPSAMIYFAGVTYDGKFLPPLGDMQLLTMAIAFFLAELAMTFLFAHAIRRLGEVVEIRIAYDDAYKVAVTAATPLWLVSLCLFLPSVMLNIAANVMALILSGLLIHYCVPDILRVEAGSPSRMLAGAILATGLLAWLAMLLFAFVSWIYVTSSLFFIPG